MSVQIDGSTGNIIAIKADYSGDVSIGGTLTYEDVTNIDAVGLITARNGIKVDDLGVQVATGATIDGATNTLTFLTNGSERLRVDSSGNLGIGAAAPKEVIDARGAAVFSGDHATSQNAYGTAHGIMLSSTSNLASIKAVSNGSNDVAIRFIPLSSGSGSEAMRIDSSGNLGLGESSSIDARLHVNSGTDNTALFLESTDGDVNLGMADNAGSCRLLQAGGNLRFRTGGNANAFGTGDSERMVLDSSGRLLIGLTSSIALGTDSYLAQIKATGSSAGLGIIRTADSVAPPFFSLVKSRSDGIVQNNDGLGKIQWIAHDGNDYNNVSALINAEVEGTPGGDDVPGRLMFHTTADGAASPTEHMRIAADGNILLKKTTAAFGTAGIRAAGDNIGLLECTRSNGQPLAVNRLTNDGHLIQFYQDSTIEGAVSVSGSTVSYVGGHLTRWSQLAGGAERTEILRGSVLSNLDEMCEWGEEDNEQLNRMKVSDVEGDRNVSGVFQDWDDDDDTYTNDFYCAMTGDFIIRIAQGTTVALGDLLMSAGDGTAKPQDDDIVRSKTIAKVTSTTRSATYSDGSYCVPCVLMAC